MKDYVRCDRCNDSLSTRKMENPITITCERCTDADFSKEKFYLLHNGSNSWSIQNEFGDFWCGVEHDWVHENSSYWISSNCINVIFDWEELKKFIEKQFNTYL